MCVCLCKVLGTNFRLDQLTGDKNVSPFGKKFIYESVVKVRVIVRVKISLQEVNFFLNHRQA